MTDTTKMYGVRFLPVLLTIALLCTAAAIVLLLYVNRGSGQGTQQLRQINEFVALSQKIPSLTVGALTGKSDAFDTLARALHRYSTLVNAVGPEAKGFGPSVELQKLSQTILGSREATFAVQKAATDVRALVPQLLQALGNVAGALGPTGVESMSRHIERFELTGMRLQQDTEALAGGVGDASLIARRLADGIDYMGQVVNGLGGEDTGLGLTRATGADAEARMKTLSALYAQLSEQVRTAITSAERVRLARESAVAVAANSDRIYTQFQDRIGMPTASSSELVSKVLPLSLLGVAAFSLVVLALLFATGGNIRKTVEMQANKNERNQEAILRLLDELSSLADGDLTVQATVTEDITGAIADSINYAIEALRELVATINDSAITLDGSVQADPELGRPAGQGCSRTVPADCAGIRISGRDGQFHRRSFRKCRTVFGRRPSLGGRCAQGWRRRAPHHRWHECDSRDHPGNVQAHQATRREFTGNRQYRRADQRYRRADQHPRAQRLDPGLDGW